MSNPDDAEFDNFSAPPRPIASRSRRIGLAGALPAARRLLPQACALCRTGCGNALLCDACAASLPALGPACPHCALPGPATVCGACLRSPRPWTQARAAWRYAYPVDRLLQGLKYGGRLALAEALAEGLANVVAEARVQLPVALVPVPLAPARQRARGFDQARLLGAHIGRHLGIAVVPALARVRDAGPQAALPLAARAANVRDAFAPVRSVRAMHVALVDDVMTTGATLAAAARALRSAGAAQIEAWVIARTLPPGP